MGFSVSGSFAIMVVAAFMAFGMAYSSGADYIENVHGATTDVSERNLDRQNTAIKIIRTEMETQGSADYLIIEIRNNGSSTLSVNGSDFLVDNHYVTHTEIANDPNSSVKVNNDGETDLWQPGETLTVNISSSILNDKLSDGNPDRVKIVTEQGVADATGVD